MPVGQPPEDEDAPREVASVVDPKVLAERRARRAEMAEESLLSRVTRAEQDRMLLATRLAEAEHDLAAARTARKTLAEDLARRERELRAAEQREFSEQRRRVEAEDEAIEARRSSRGDLDTLRRQVQAAEQRVDELGRELEVAQREAAEAARTAAQERARAERSTTGSGERRALLAEQEQDLRRRVAEVERLEQQARAVETHLEQRHATLEGEIVALRTFADELDGTLRAEHGRRVALETELAAERERTTAEVTLLQHELDRRTRERDAAAEERDRLATTLETVRAQLAAALDTVVEREAALAGLRAQALAAVEDLEGRLAAEQARRLETDEVARQARADAERAVAQEMQGATEQLTAAREEVRAARLEAAEANAARVALQDELHRRAQLEVEVRAAIGEVSERLQDAEAQDAARAERDAAVEALVTELVETASSLRAGYEKELVETERRLRGQVDEERARFASELESMEARIDVLRTQIDGAADELREQLEIERRARRVAEEELSAERERGHDDRAGAADAARAQAELDHVPAAQTDVAEVGPPAAPEDAAEPGAPERSGAPVPAPRFDVTGLDPETASLIGDLQAAADRLRARVAIDAGPVPSPEAPAEPAAPAAIEPEPEPVTADVQVLEPGPPAGPAGPWLASALSRVAMTDPALGARLLPAVLATHGLRSDRDLGYDLIDEDVGTWHVRLQDGAASVDHGEGGTGGDVDFALTGPLDVLLPFAAGGTGKRPAGVRIRGRKRRLRRLLKSLRAPVGLAEIAAAGAHVDPVDLLTLLAGEVDPDGLAGHGFSIDYDHGGPAGGVVHVAVADGAVAVRDGADPAGATAVVEASDRALLALLGGAAPPSDERVVVRGRADAAELLHGWFDHVQGLRR